jgi:hypothetical protein
MRVSSHLSIHQIAITLKNCDALARIHQGDMVAASGESQPSPQRDMTMTANTNDTDNLQALDFKLEQLEASTMLITDEGREAFKLLTDRAHDAYLSMIADAVSECRALLGREIGRTA